MGTFVCRGNSAQIKSVSNRFVLQSAVEYQFRQLERMCAAGRENA